LQSFLKELGQYRKILPKNTIKTLRGQALAGNILEAKKGLNRIKARMLGGDISYADCSSKLKKR
jgi:hypothetical protein